MRVSKEQGDLTLKAAWVALFSHVDQVFNILLISVLA